MAKLIPSLPRLIQPAGYTIERIAAAYATDCRTAHLNDAWAAIWSHRMRGRLALLLARMFDRLRAGTDVATGRPANDPTTIVAVPAGLWSAPEAVVDTLAGDVLIGTTPAFVGVMIQPPVSRRRGVSRSALDRFARAFGEALVAMDRQFALGELVDAVQRELGETSTREVEASIRRASPRAWAGSGRRAAALTPTAAELAQAARHAAETRRQRYCSRATDAYCAKAEKQTLRTSYARGGRRRRASTGL